MPLTLPSPPHVQQAYLQLEGALRSVEGKEVDLLDAPWTEVEKSVVKLLGGPFQPNRADHTTIALGLSGAFAQRLATQSGAFWFPNRDTLEGAALGFPDALMTLSPFTAVVDALSSSNLGMLEEASKDIRNALAQAKFSLQQGGGNQRLSPEIYARLFDAGFIQLVLMDPQRVKETLESTPDKLSREIKDALSRSRELPNELKAQFQAQLVGALERLNPTVPLVDQAVSAGRAPELMAHLFGTVQNTGIAPEDFWASVAIPLLHIGPVANFPPLDEEELRAAQSGVDSWLLYVDAVPYTFPADEDGVLGVFPEGSLQLPHPTLAGIPLRLIGVDKEKLAQPLQAFDQAKLQDSLLRFEGYVAEKTGQPATTSPEGQKMLEASLSLLSGLKEAMAAAPANSQLYMRRITEAEAQSEAALSALRKVLQGPRLILV